MARKVETYLIDDLDGGPADEIVKFSLDGQDMQIDLSTKNASKLRQTLGRYIEHGTRVRAHVAVSTRPGAARSRTDREGTQIRNMAIRAWAAEHGIEVHPRGRIKQEIVDQYDAAQREPAPETTNGSRSARRRRRVTTDA